jgi:hypothetical protein
MSGGQDTTFQARGVAAGGAAWLSDRCASRKVPGDPWRGDPDGQGGVNPVLIYAPAPSGLQATEGAGSATPLAAGPLSRNAAAPALALLAAAGPGLREGGRARAPPPHTRARRAPRPPGGADAAPVVPSPRPRPVATAHTCQREAPPRPPKGGGVGATFRAAMGLGRYVPPRVASAQGATLSAQWPHKQKRGV